MTCTPSDSTNGTSITPTGTGGSYGSGWGCDTTVIYVGSADIETGWVSFSVSIPQGSQINKAYIRYTGKAGGSTYSGDDVHVRIYGNADLSSVGCGNVASVTRTTEYVSWDSPPTWSSGNEYDSPNIGCVVQELVDDVSWTGTSDELTFLIDNQGSSDLRGANADDPVLYLWWEEASTGGGSGGGIDGPSVAWFKFRDIEIPKPDESLSVTVNQCYLTFTAFGTTITPFDGDVKMGITMECGDNTNDIDCIYNKPSDLDRLATIIDWTDSTGWVSNETYDTPDLACLVQEKINTDDWQSGNDMLFLFLTDSTGTDYHATRYAYDYDQDSTKAALLTLYYSVSNIGNGGVLAGGSANDTITYNIVGGGGALAGGVADVGYVSSQIFEIGDGGCLVGGSAVDSIIYQPATTGGALVGGLALNWSQFTSFTYRLAITVPAGSVVEDLENFYLGINVDVEPSHVFYGSDFQITDDASVKIYHDLRSYNPSSGQVIIFFRCDLLSGSDNVFYLEYGGVI
tara:strand:- start:13 stop:1554 length:1542 start_codon:yes stop_codon:yes gene_type:complete